MYAKAPSTVRPQARAARNVQAAAIRDGAPLDRPLRVAVVGGGPSGACAAEILAAGGIETFMIERKLDNCKVGAGWLRSDSPQEDCFAYWVQ